MYITLGRMNQVPFLTCREVSANEDIAALTVLIRSAYAPHAASGLRYWATHQSAEDTAKRLASGHGFIAEFEGVVVATVTLRQPEPESKVALLRVAYHLVFRSVRCRAGAQGQRLWKTNP